MNEYVNVLHNALLDWRVTDMLRALFRRDEQYFDKLTYAVFGYRDGADAVDPRAFWPVTWLIEALYDLHMATCP